MPAPEKKVKKSPCPPVPLAPETDRNGNNVSVDSNVKRAIEHRPTGLVNNWKDAKWF